MDQVIQLEQWKRAKEVLISTKRYYFWLEYFVSCKSVTLRVHDSDGKQVEQIRKVFLRSSTLNFFCIHFFKFDNIEHFLRFPGLPERLDKKYFRMQNSGDVLEIDRIDSRKQICFARLSAAEVPRDIVIQD